MIAGKQHPAQNGAEDKCRKPGPAQKPGRTLDWDEDLWASFHVPFGVFAPDPMTV
jgi:hypothetical protein